MDDRKRDKLNMYVLVKDFLLAQTAITGKWAAFAALFASFVNYVAEIFRVSGMQTDDKTGVTKTKSQLKALLIDKIVDISGKCVAYAIVTEDNAFLSLIKFVKTDLQKTADADLVKTAQTFHANVLPKLALIADYDLSQAELDALLSLNSDFLAIYTKPAGNKKEGTQLTAKLNTLFALADKLLVKMDAIINSAHKSAPAFVDEYNSKRVIVKTASRSRALQLEVLNDATGEPLAKAKVTIKSAAGPDLAKIVKRTGKQGNITKDILTDGEYTFEVEYNGCITERGSLFINNGVMTKVVVRMRKSE
jgi:5-hydroxyisourate hydrolase-like protein (transthyretin family)